MIIPLVDDCGTQMHIGVDDETNKWVAFCPDCDGAEYYITVLELTPESVKNIKAAFLHAEMGKKLSYMVKRV